jgi:hypothetical protein
MTGEFINYQAILAQSPSFDIETAASFLAEELPYEWAGAYKESSQHQTNILRIRIGGFEYLFDYASEAEESQGIEENTAVESRLVAVHGRSQTEKRKRKDSIMHRQPLGPIEFIEPLRRTRYDRGHFIAHSLGGDLNINIFPQPTDINRGWSDSGKLFRSMERYCQNNAGTYCFSRPLYKAESWHPYVVEFGVLKADGTLWVNPFPNCRDEEEMAEIERLLREKISSLALRPFAADRS